MKRFIFLGFLASLIFSCSLSNGQDKKRIKLVDSLNGIGISFFNNWSYNNRGTTNVKTWYKFINDSIVYSCQFLKLNEYEEILITYPKGFLDEQKISIEVGDAITCKAYRFKDSIVFTKLNTESGKYERAGVITKKSNHSLFTENGAFNSLERMGEKLDKIGVREAQSYKGRIRFIMLDDDLLFYLPDNIDDDFKKREIVGCKMIKPNWWYYVKKN